MAMDIEMRDDDAAVVIKVTGEVDLYTSPKLRTAVLDALKKQATVGVDLSGVGYMDSSGVATLVEGLKSATDAKKDFVVVAPSSSVLKVLQLSRLDKVFAIRESL